jgi:hypothetical protein
VEDLSMQCNMSVGTNVAGNDHPNFGGWEGVQIANSPVAAVATKGGGSCEGAGVAQVRSPFPSFVSPAAKEEQYMPSPQFSASSTRARELLDRMNALNSTLDSAGTDEGSGEVNGSPSRSTPPQSPNMGLDGTTALGESRDGEQASISPFATPSPDADEGEFVPSPQFSESSSRAKALLDRMNALNATMEMTEDEDSTIDI